jgi:hypothetical protein
MDTLHALAAERLIADLNKLRLAAGSPSLGQLVRLSQRKLSKSTLNDHLSGRRAKLPPWRLVSAYVAACHAAAESTGLDLAKLGTLEEWHTRWVAALNGKNDAISPIKESASAMQQVTVILDREKIDEFRNQQMTGIADVLTMRNEKSASLTPFLQRFEEDLSRLRESLSEYTGLIAVASGPNIGTRFEVQHNITTIGRDPESDIWLNEPSVSRRHAVIHRYGDHFTVHDVNSSNGTFLRHQQITVESSLSSYDEIQVGAAKLLFVQGGESHEGPYAQRYHPVRSRLEEDITALTWPLGGPRMPE